MTRRTQSLDVRIDLESAFRQWSDVVPFGGSDDATGGQTHDAQRRLIEQPGTRMLQAPTAEARGCLRPLPRRPAMGRAVRLPTGRTRARWRQRHQRISAMVVAFNALSRKSGQI